MAEVRQRKKRSRLTKTAEGTEADSNEARKTASPSNTNSLWSYLNVFVGLVVMVICGYKHGVYMSTLHDNMLWFTNIKEVEREISFRTESGLYYSYYKQMVLAPSLADGLHGLTHDNLTEHPDTINVLERMNIYQEVILGILYRILPIKSWVEPIFFYINIIFGLHGMLVCALFATSYMLSGSWLSGVLTACLYIFNKVDTTRVEFVIPLRESFSLPFLWVQIAATSYYFRPGNSKQQESLAVGTIMTSTFLFALFWQFNQFIFLLQAFALFGVWVLDMVPPYKIRMLFYAQASSLLLTCLLQFVNRMIIGSLVLSFIPAALLLMYFRGDEIQPCSIPTRLVKVVGYSLSVLILMLLFNQAIKFVINIEADEHIFKFIMSKFGVAHGRDFDSRLYLCIDAFGFLSFDTYERLTRGVVFPLYVVTHVVLLVVLLISVFQNWSNHVHDGNVKDHTNTKKSHLLHNRPEVAYHTVLAVFFGALGISTLRMKYLWTPYMCILGSFGISDYRAWKTVLVHLKAQGVIVQIVRHFATLLSLAILLALALPPALKELEDLKEFWDPDTVDLMEWAKAKVAPDSAFTGSMQLLAGVKLCTGRPITNHPHYEDKYLRFKTKELYQMYGRRTPEDVHAIMKKYKSSYIILEDSICMAPSKGNCRLPDLIDIDNGIIPDNGKVEPGLVKSTIPRFCDEIRYNRTEFVKYFKPVFSNRTFRVYKVL